MNYTSQLYTKLYQYDTGHSERYLDLHYKEAKKIIESLPEDMIESIDECLNDLPVSNIKNKIILDKYPMQNGVINALCYIYLEVYGKRYPRKWLPIG